MIVDTSILPLVDTTGWSSSEQPFILQVGLTCLCSFQCRPTLGALPTMWSIAQKVKWEAFFWGFGTALGELPPYFVARAGKMDSI